MKLFEIDSEIEKISTEAYDEETGEVLNEELFKRLDELVMERNTKIDNLCLWYKNLKSDAAQLKEVADAYAKRQKSAEDKAESVKNYLKYALAGEKFKTTMNNVWFRNTKSVEVNIPAEILPKEYQRVTVEADKRELKKAMEEGKKVDGCELVEKQSIIIK